MCKMTLPLIRGVLADHPFVEGKKRTAMLNGLSFTAKTGDIENFAVEIATDNVDVPQIASWLQARIK